MGHAARTRAAADILTANLSDVSHLTPIQLKAAALHASAALAHIDALMTLERPKSARHNRLLGAMEPIMRCVDLYRLQAFRHEDLCNAEAVFDAASDKIAELYPQEGK
jgi:hypothetical protein